MIDRFKGRSERIDRWLERQAAPHLKTSDITLVELENIIHYLESSSAPKKINKISLPLAKTNMEQWLSKLQARKIAQDEADTAVELVFEDTPYRWVKLTTKEAYDREGKLMGHCVASYFDKTHTVIYSLRDEDNVPHCTIEMRDNKIYQIKGKTNLPVTAKYHSALRKFINQAGLPIHTHDAWQYGWLVIGDKMVEESELPDEVEVTWSQDQIQLSKYAKIPSLMIVHSVKIRDQKNLDLSKWKIKSMLEIENCQNVILPQELPTSLTLNNVKFKKEFLPILKEKELKLNNFNLINTALIVKSLSVTHLNNFKKAYFQGEKLSATNIFNLTDTPLHADEIFIKALNKSDSLNVSNLEFVKKITVCLLVVTESIIPLIDRIYLNSSCNVELKINSKWTWPAHWKKAHYVVLNEALLTLVDFTNLKEIMCLSSVDKYLIIGAKPHINIRSYIDDRIINQDVKYVDKTPIKKKNKD